MPIADGRRWPGAGAALALLLAGGLMLSGQADAAPLDKEACDALQTEHAELVKNGAPEAMRKGPVWAKANLPAAKVAAIQRFIALEEQLLFRCGQDKARVQPEPEAPAASAAAATDSVKGAKGPKPPVARKAPAKAAVPGKGQAAPDAATEPKAKSKPKQPVKPKPKPKPKTKADDAFRPSAKSEAAGSAPGERVQP